MPPSPPLGHPPPSAPLRRFDRGAWLTLVLALLIIALNLTLVLPALLLPSDGWAYSELAWRPGQPAWVAERALSSVAAPLLPGDQVLTIDGLPVSELEAGAFALNPTRPPGWRAGGLVRYEVLRNGQSVELTVALHRLSLAEVLRYYRPAEADFVLYLVLPLTLAIAFFVFWQRPALLAARVMLLFGAALVTSFVEMPITSAGLVYPGVLVLPILVSPWQFALLPTLLHLLLVFPVVKRPLRQRPRLTLALLYGAAQVIIWLGWLIYWGQPAAMVGFYYAVVLVHAVLVFVLMLASVLHSWITQRTPVARAQTAWMTFGLMVGFVGTASLWLVATYVFYSWGSVWQLTSGTLLLALPLGLAIAILRYRLFDIDVIINRALVYGTLTALLALAYFGTVVLLQSVLRFFTGAAQSQFVTVVSTLAIAALFTPLRLRLQTIIDRRFSRRKYDAARTLAAFGATLRDEVDLSVLNQRLVGVVQDTMEPAQAWLWLRPGPGTRHERGGDQR